jgi:hypothetical protein
MQSEKTRDRQPGDEIQIRMATDGDNLNQSVISVQLALTGK